MSDPSPDKDQTYFIRNRGRVLGPFTVDKLKSLRSRGQFSRVHEVSTDRTSWSPGSSLDHLFTVPSAGGATTAIPARGIVPSTADPSAGFPIANLSGPPPLANQFGTNQFGTNQFGAGQPPGTSPDDHTLWYYRVNEQQYGPATTADVQSLIGSGRLGPLDYVWRDGLMEWSTVEDTAELGSRSLFPPRMPVASSGGQARRRRRAWLLAMLILAIAALAVASVYFGLFGKLAALIPGAADMAPNVLPAPIEAPADADPRDADDAEPVDTGAINSIEGMEVRAPVGGAFFRAANAHIMFS
ncbi:MAG TPA: DUF4339 domain-containing protein [Planctomycetaceae bacterium]